MIPDSVFKIFGRDDVESMEKVSENQNDAIVKGKRITFDFPIIKLQFGYSFSDHFNIQRVLIVKLLQVIVVVLNEIFSVHHCFVEYFLVWGAEFKESAKLLQLLILVLHIVLNHSIGIFIDFVKDSDPVGINFWIFVYFFSLLNQALKTKV